MIIYHEFKVIFHYSKYFKVYFNQGYTNPGCQFAQATKLFVVAPTTCVCCGRNLLYVIIYVPRIFEVTCRFFYCWKIREPSSDKDVLVYVHK